VARIDALGEYYCAVRRMNLRPRLWVPQVFSVESPADAGR
jgi:hypothetical protein